MPRIRSIPLSLALLASLFCVHARAANPPTPWLEIHSTHFTVITDTGEKRGSEVALRFEQMRTVFATLLLKEHLHQSIPLTILAFQNDKSYYQLAPLSQGQPIDVPGFFLPGDDQDFIVLNMSEPQPWRAVARDFAMMLLSYNYPPAQGWFDEGLTDYFSSIRIDDGQVQIGGDPRANNHETQPASTLTGLLSTRTWLSLPDLFTAKHSTSIGSQGNPPTIYEAESWIVMHYLLHEKKLPETGTYFGLTLNQRVPVADAIQQAYRMSSAQLEQAVKDYFHAQTTPVAASGAARPNAASGLVEHFPVPVSPGDSAITSKPLPVEDATAIYAGVQIRIPERRELGLKTLQTLATTPTEADKKSEAKQTTKRVGEDPDRLPSDAIGNAIAHRMLAWDHIQHGEFEQAFTEIGDAAALDPRDMWERYYLSLAKYRMAQARHTDILGLANMMLDLRGVLEWNPEMADAYDLLALARNAGGGPTAAMEAERAAMALSPRNEYYVFHLAQIYVASKKWDAANVLLDRLKASSNPKIVSLASDLMSQAGAERKYGIATNSTDAAQPKYEPQKTPFDVLDEDAARRAATETGTSADKRVTKFVKGRLVAVDCSQPPTAVLTVSSEAGVLKLRAADYRSLLLIGADDFSCDWRDRQVTVNYKPGAGSGGDVVSLELR